MNIINMESNKDLVMNSHEFLTKIINPARVDAGEKPVRHNDLVNRIEDELDDQELCYENFVTRGGHSRKVFTLNYKQLLLVGMRESKAVRRVVLDRLEEAYKTIANMVDGIKAGNLETAISHGELFLEREKDNRALAFDGLKGKPSNPSGLLAAIKAGNLTKDQALLMAPSSYWRKKIKAL